MISRKTILVTGASGFLGSHIIQELLETTPHSIIALYRSYAHSSDEFYEGRLKSYSVSDYLKMNVVGIDTVINCAFPRTNSINELADALSFTEIMIEKWKQDRVVSVINISTQGVYQRLNAGNLSSENSPIAPIDVYSLVKYSTELLFHNSSLPYVTNVRLSSLNMPQRFLSIFVSNVINEKPIVLTSPNNYTSLLDVTDAAKAIKQLIMLPEEKRAETYNLGTGEQLSILQYAEIVKTVGEECGYHPSIIVENTNNSFAHSGMDCSNFSSDCHWKAEVTPRMMIEKLFADK